MGSGIFAEYVEIDLPYCSLTFGESPCTAAGVPCFNSRNNSHDCGDTANFTATTLTVRFAIDNGHRFWPQDTVPTYPILISANSRSAEIEPAESMGVRATCTISLKNCLSVMAGIDKNIIARADDFERGTFLGKLKARFPYIHGAEVRVYRGVVGDDLTRNPEYYTIDDFSGPSNNGGMTFKCVDFLKLTNGKTSQFPRPSNGVLIANIDKVATSFTVEPAGIGDLEYPASGQIAVGKEAMTFTRVGDVFTVARGIYDVAEDHKAGDLVQLFGIYTSQSSAEIIYDLIVNYTPLDASYIDLDAWNSEITNFQSSLYSAWIGKPESVNSLINEIIEQAGLIFYADIKARKIILKVLRPIVSAETITTDRIMNFNQSEHQQKRVSQVWTYYNQRNPLEKLNDEHNFYSAVISPSAENLYPTEVIKKIYSRWIPTGAQVIAVDLNSRILQRSIHPPREFSFRVHNDYPFTLGQPAMVKHRALEDAFGDAVPRPVFITELNYGKGQNSVTAQEYTFTNYVGLGGSGDIVIPIDDNPLSINLRERLDLWLSSLAGVSSITFIVPTGCYVGGKNSELYAITVGDFGAFTPKLIIEDGGYVIGAGGTGAVIGTTGNGGPAINADYPIDIENLGIIGGGGGCGGAGYLDFEFKVGNSTSRITIEQGTGAAGAGYTEGFGVFLPVFEISHKGYRNIGQTVAECVEAYKQYDIDVKVSNMGNGGGLGQNGFAGSAGLGGTAGEAIVGNSNITWINAGDIRGSIS